MEVVRHNLKFYLTRHSTSPVLIPQKISSRYSFTDSFNQYSISRGFFHLVLLLFLTFFSSIGIDMFFSQLKPTKIICNT